MNRHFFVLAFNVIDNRIDHSRYFLPAAKVENYNIMMDGKNLFNQPIKNSIKTYDIIQKIAIGEGDDYNSSCLLDYHIITLKTTIKL